MDRTLRYLFFLFAAILVSCTKNEFKLQFELSSGVTGNYNVTYYATDDDGGRTIQAVASVRNGKCELECVTKTPTLLYVTTNKSHFPLVIYAERGKDIKISGDSINPLSWAVGDHKINKELSDWRINNLKVLTSYDTLEVNNAVKKYVEKNRDNPVSLILLQSYYTRFKDEKEFASLSSLLTGDAKDKEWIRMTGRTDFHSTYQREPATLKSVILRSNHESGDTVMIDGKNPMFLAFWQTGTTTNKSITDSLRTIVKDYPDSLRIVADVCLDIDSVSWKSAIRRDSLIDKIKRLWVPSGLADPVVMDLKVTSIPYFIVFDKSGKQLYRGSELPEAMKEYRSQMPQKDKE